MALATTYILVTSEIQTLHQPPWERFPHSVKNVYPEVHTFLLTQRQDCASLDLKQLMTSLGYMAGGSSRFYLSSQSFYIPSLSLPDPHKAYVTNCHIYQTSSGGFPFLQVLS